MTLQTLQQYLMMKSCDTHQGPKFVHTTAGSIGLQGLHGISIGQKLACKTASIHEDMKIQFSAVESRLWPTHSLASPVSFSCITDNLGKILFKILLKNAKSSRKCGCARLLWNSHTHVELDMASHAMKCHSESPD